ncbi:MAG: 23S rRNA (adenine(2503)-C(2))-methyltransferase RlmN [Syntrophomonadaceae bacterium]|nr:23S rRNA (adenine(2503)-C(2))-methyltransferase RlmN [Syntrophomonadaceae bacterium]
MNTKNKTQLLGKKRSEIEDYLDSMGESRFRGRQIHKWIYKKQCSSFFEMTDLPRELRQILEDNARISIPRVLKQRVSSDGSRKFLLELDDKKRIETVLIPHSDEKDSKYTICLSTQVGCPIACSFCATGLSGFQRNLDAYEIAGQLLGSQRELAKRLKLPDSNNLISNVVYMGMGEPMLNYDEVIASIHILNDPQGINMGQRNITISTAGEVKGIDLMAQENLQVTLAISLHACDNELRSGLIPLNRKYPLEKLLPAIRNYIAKTNRRVTFEYIMLDNINISKRDAQNMVQLLKSLLANVNLIPYNEVEALDFKRPSPQRIKQFYNWLIQGGLNVSIREERGGDISAACGQLSLEQQKGKK